MELVQKVNSSGFGLHLDTACMTLSDEPVEAVLENCAGAVCHFHVSECYLGQVGMRNINHNNVASALRQTGYQGWVSVEMRYNQESNTMNTLRKVFSFLKETYGS